MNNKSMRNKGGALLSARAGGTLAIAVALALSGCGTAKPRDGTTYDKIAADLQAAADSRAKLEQPVTPALSGLVPPLTVDIPKAASTLPEQRFDLAVTNAPAGQVLNALVNGTRFSMLAHPDVKEPISLNLKNATVQEAMDSIHELYGYDYKIEGTRIFVYPLTLQTRMFQVDYLTSQRIGSADLRVSSNTLAPSQPVGFAAASATIQAQQGAGQNSDVKTNSMNNFWAELRSTLAALVGCVETAPPALSTPPVPGQPDLRPNTITCQGGRQVVVSPQSGVVVIRAMPGELKSIGEYLRASRIAVEKQVLIEAKILEVTLNDSYQAGVNWAKFFTPNNGTLGIGTFTPGTQLGTTNSNLPLVGGTPPGALNTPLRAGIPLSASSPDTPFGTAAGQVMAAGAGASGTLFGLALQTSSLAALMTFLETQGTVHVLSSPRISALNNQKAVLKVGEDKLFVTRITGGTIQAAVVGTAPTVTAPTFNLEPFFSGIALDVTPRINEDNSIVLHVRPSISSVSQSLSDIDLGQLGLFRIPLVSSNVSETDSVIRAQDNQVVAIGGLMRQRQSENRSGVPGASGVPFLGGLFRGTEQASEKRELVILLKPTIIHSDKDWADNIRDTNSRVKTLNRGFSWGSRSEVFGLEAERPSRSEQR